MEERQLEIANRMKNIIWTVCGDYTLEAKPDVEAFLKSKYIALYDGIKQGAFAKYFEKEKLSMYLVKKVYLGAREDALVAIAQLCMEKAVGDRIARERKGVSSIQKKAYEYVLDHEMDMMVKSEFGRLQLAMMRQVLTGERRCEEKIRKQLDRIEPLEKAADTMEVIRTIDDCYNAWVDPEFEQIHGDLSKVLAVTVEELMEYSWQDFLTEDMYEENFEAYLEQMSQQMTATGQNHAEEKKDEKESSKKRKIVRVSEEDLKKVYTYIELNFGKTYLSPLEEKKINFQLCRGIHADCGLYFTDGILANPVKKNYQLEYAKKQQGKNKYAYYDNHRTVKQNIVILSGILKKAMAMRQEEITILSDRGKICPERLWKIGRSRDAKLFSQICPADGSTFVVDVLIDASGSQRVRQEQVALQAYIIMQALSSVHIPHRVMSFCTFWDHTILQRYREYDEDASANEKIFNFTTSSNNRDGLAIRAASLGLLEREEERKIMIILSDGRPYDVILNRPNGRNPQPYQGKYAVRDTGTEVRRLRNLGVSVLGVFAGEEKDLEAEKKIFGRDFAYIRDISRFSRIVGSYLNKQIEENC
ncbi:nitric oxide reductase activation protein [Lachnospiraceae bacterium BSM-380-WT-5A]|uniref:Nitric oxide reductase activation protein n=1 Tax=Oliverpabstia intestinalis TaxID=2606633 RepID=A0A7X2P3B0_9FIRM|nr:nitric oxide reductase activation protein [Oliverpabstia intestinalis]